MAGTPANKFEVVKGERYGTLKVLYEIRRMKENQKHHTTVLCLCDCGKEKAIRLEALKSGHTKSCGCVSSELRHAKQAKVKKGRRSSR